MSAFDINNVRVTFPYEPYEIQKDYMTKVIESLQTQKHAILESPTGTGKTLCLLCASLSWLMTEKLKMAANQHENYFKLDDNLENMGDLKPISRWGTPKIIYTSRTHSQLAQAMQELKATVYKDMVKASIVGSRDQMCLKPEVLEERVNMLQVAKCRTLVKAKQCSLHYGVEKQKERIMSSANVWDIEDLVKNGKKQHFCPYYMARELKQVADITFMPYNYILDPNARKTFDVELNNAVIIFDEAHNVEKMCEESASTQITTTDIAMAIDELTHLMKAMEKNADLFEMDSDVSKDFTLDDLVILKGLMLEFEKVITGIRVKDSAGDTYDGQHLQKLLEQAGIDVNNRQYICNISDKLVQYMSTTQNEAFNRNGQNLMKVKDLLITIHANDSDVLREKVKKCFRVHIVEEQIQQRGRASKTSSGWITPAGPSTKKAQKIVNYWCFSPGFGMESLLRHGVRNIILTSGTLAPLKPLISELAMEVPIRLENPHIISKSQCLVKIVSMGLGNVTLDSSYKNRENTAYIDSLGKTIKAVSRMIPEGLLVFFPSYPVLNTCADRWQENGIWSGICEVKPIFVEPRNKDDFNNVIAAYYAQIHAPNSKGACFFAVLRGKVSEGLDFANENGRGVIITGLPFPPLKDPRIILKRKYLDMHATQANEMANGQKWYTLEAIRAVNQAIGRVIRHKRDYGCILLCDHRFDNPNLRNDLSKWLRDYIQKASTFAQAISGITKFFHEAKEQFPTKNDASNIDNEPDKKPAITYNYNETAFGNNMICQTGTKDVKLPSTDHSSDLKILTDYKTADTSPIDTNKSNNSSFLDRMNNAQQVLRLQQPHDAPSSSGSVKIHEMNPRKKRKVVMSQTPNMNKYLTPEPDLPQSTKLAAENIRRMVKAFPKDKVNSFHEQILLYKKDNSIFDFIKCIHELLRESIESSTYLNEMVNFIKPQHKFLFETYIKLRVQWDVLPVEHRKPDNYDRYLLKNN